MTVMEFTTNGGESTSKKGTKCLFLTSRDITQDTNIFRENVFTSSKNGHRICLRVLDTRSVRRDVISCHFLEFSKNAADLETLLKVIVLVGINKLDVFTSV